MVGTQANRCTNQVDDLNKLFQTLSETLKETCLTEPRALLVPQLFGSLLKVIHIGHLPSCNQDLSKGTSRRPEPLTFHT